MISDTISFKEFIWKSTINKLLLIGGIVTCITIWITFKNYYPNANLIFDSYHYLIATESNASVYAWPIGYPQFIRLVGTISHSANFFTSLQYFLLEISFLYLLLTIRYFFKVSSATSIIIFLLFHLNPIFIYTSNIIISDILFTTISMAWLTQLLWIIFSPRNWFIFTHSALLLFAFTIRYNALYYPIISLLAFLLTDRSLKFKISGIFLSFFVVAGFITFTSHKMELNYGVRQFSPFGGWKLANDALYMYEYEYKSNHDSIPIRFKDLDNTVRRYFNHPHEPVSISKPDITSGSYYMYIYPSPLMEYMRKTQGDDPFPLNFKVFAPMGPLYQDYGTFLINKYPISFLNYFIFPNIYRYLYPPQEVYTDDVNPFILRNDDIDASARKWFRINSTEASEKAINFRHKIFKTYPIFNTIIHCIFILSSFTFIIFGILKDIPKKIDSGVILVMVLFTVDFGFSIFAAAVVLRYEIFITIIEIIFSLLMIEYMLHIGNKNRPIMKSAK